MDRIDGQSGAVFWFAFPYRPDFTTSPASPYSELASEVRVRVKMNQCDSKSGSDSENENESENDSQSESESESGSDSETYDRFDIQSQLV